MIIDAKEKLEEAIKELKCNEEDDTFVISWEALDMAIKALEQEPKWIPVSERLPENGDLQIITILDEWGDYPFRYSDFGWYLEAAKCWIVGTETRTDIIAWMPLPEPYKAESEKIKDDKRRSKKRNN